MSLKVLWWGRFDPGYSRNVVLREAMTSLGCSLSVLRPKCSRFGDIEAMLKGTETPDVVWVGAFRQRDVAAAVRWARRRGVKVVFDPLISQYDKSVNEFHKLKPGSIGARRLLRRESGIFRSADIVVADTVMHRDYYSEVLKVPREKLKVVYVGADSHFNSVDTVRCSSDMLEVLFYGSFLPLQGPKTIVEAARLTQGLPVRWTLIGDGPEKTGSMAAAKGLENVVFKDPVPYRDLPSVIAGFDVLLGVFGSTEKSKRVMPNKFFQALASGKPIITMRSGAYPETVLADKAVKFIDSDNASALADAVTEYLNDPGALAEATSRARSLFEREFSLKVIVSQVEDVFTFIRAYR